MSRRSTLAALALGAALAILAACGDVASPAPAAAAPDAPRFSSGQKAGQCFLQLGLAATQVPPRQSGTTLTAPEGEVVTRVAIKAGTACYVTPAGVTGSYPFSVAGAPCYVVEGLGTATVTVTRVGSGPLCKDISTIEYVTGPAVSSGYLQICKELPIMPTESYTFAFDVAAPTPLRVTIVTQVGRGRTCADPIELPTGPVVVTEEFAPGFQLFGIVSEGVGPLLSKDLAAQTATVEIVSGTTTLVFQNTLDAEDPDT